MAVLNYSVVLASDLFCCLLTTPFEEKPFAFLLYISFEESISYRVYWGVYDRNTHVIKATHFTADVFWVLATTLCFVNDAFWREAFYRFKVIIWFINKSLILLNIKKNIK